MLSLILYSLAQRIFFRVLKVTPENSCLKNFRPKVIIEEILNRLNAEKWEIELDMAFHSKHQGQLNA